MDSIASSNFVSTENYDFSPLFGLTLTERSRHQPSVSLVEQLQTSLEIDVLLEIFSMEAAKIMRFCGLSISFDEHTVAMRGSMPGKHRFNFNIRVQNEVIAQLSYSLVEGLNRHAIRSLDTLHNQLAYPLRNAIEFYKVKKLAMKDYLTGLGNRGHFDDSLNKAMMAAKRKGNTFALVMMDLDNFKQVNDNYGHQSGDVVLQTYAEILTDSIRGEDMAFRFGGDEFAIIADSQTENDAHSITARIQHNVANHPLMKKYSVSASIGFSFFKPNDTMSSLYERTDKALYCAKEFGRNCIKTA